MFCANETCSTIVVESQTSPYWPHGIQPRILPDSKYADPEHVWGDEGPISEERETS